MNDGDRFGRLTVTAHTPGPWLVARDYVYSQSNDSGHDEPSNVQGYDGHLICESIHPRNQSLIAAAPDLLAACKSAVLMLSTADSAHIRAAINAADPGYFQRTEAERA